MRNIFDQYQQPENRLTHALACALQLDRNLIRPFLELAGASRIPPTKEIQIVEQQIPGEPISGEEAASESLPDVSFYDRNGWAVVVEAKIQAGINWNQLQRHARIAKRCGFKHLTVILLSVDRPQSIQKGVKWLEWQQVYAMLHKQTQSIWAKRFVDYLRVFESKMIAEEYNIRGKLTMFNGIYYSGDGQYSYAEAKTLIRQLGDELQKRKDLRRLGVDPKGQRRPAITGRDDDGVWDFLSLRKARGASSFTHFPHLTLVLRTWSATVQIGVPNAVKGGFRKRLKRAGPDGFQNLVLKIEKRLRPIVKSTGAMPYVSAFQRHYASQRSPAEYDAELKADARTLVGTSKIKYQPQWIDAIYKVLCEKQSNIHLVMAIDFEYGCKDLDSRRALDLIAKAWIAMSPLLDFVLDD